MRKILLIAVAVCCLGFITRADDVVTIGSRYSQNPTDIIDWYQLGPDGNVLTTPQIVSTFNGYPVLLGNIDGSGFERVDDGATWTGNFDVGESLITNLGSSLPFLLEFSGGVGSVGFDIDTFAWGNFTAQLTAFNCSYAPIYSQTFSGVSNGAGNGSALFVGVGDTTAANICALAISTTDVNGGNFFAIDDVSFTYGPFVDPEDPFAPGQPSVPEPGSLALLCGGLVGMVGLRRRKASV